MPQEASRTTARKTVILPSGERIKVPVITKIAFVDPFDRYQETEHAIDNSTDSNRLVHVDLVHPTEVDENGAATSETPSSEPSESLYVERIDTWNAVDPFERYQETQLTLDNRTGNDLAPPHFSNHEKTHIYRYHQDPANPDDDGVWVDSELIDEFTVIDPLDRYQETHYTLVNPTNGDFQSGDASGQASTDDPDVTIGGDAEGTQANPVRLDPFQNIVNYSSGLYVLVQFSWRDQATSGFPEYCVRVSNSPSVNALHDGLQTTFQSSSGVTIDLIGDTDNPTSDTLNEPTVETVEAFASGYEVFGDCFDQDCEGFPDNVDTAGQGKPVGCLDTAGNHVHFFADPVPYNEYHKSFLFDQGFSDADQNPTADAPKLLFEFSGIPNTKKWANIVDVLTDNQPGPGFTYTRRTYEFGTTLQLTIWTFKKSKVDVYLADNIFPLRKKDIIPTAEDAVDQTKAVAESRTMNINASGWLDAADEDSALLHETFGDPEESTGDPTGGNPTAGGVSGPQEFELLFERRELDLFEGPKKVPIGWPKRPQAQTQMVRPSFTPGSAPLEERPIEQYIVIGATGTFDFGEAPSGTA